MPVRTAISLCAFILLSALHGFAQQQDSSATKAVSQTPAGTVIQAGVISGAFVLSQSPYRIQGNVVVPAGQTLVIDSGVVILMEGQYPNITVYGQILAQGTKGSPVVFKSGKSDPKPWDWDRILFRSKTRSFLQNCVIQHSNFGVYAVNTGLTLIDCRFSRNSIHGLFVENSNVTLQGCTFERGHVCAILIERNGQVDAERDTIRGNINGIACSDFSRLDMRNSFFEENDIGLATRKNASVNLVDTKISENKTGVLGETMLPKKALKNIYQNSLDFALGEKDQLDKVFKKPAEVSSLITSKQSEVPEAPKDFKAGFASGEAPREAFVQIVGNATLGMKYYRPTNFIHPRDSVISSIDSTKSPAETTWTDTTYSQTRYIEGLQPEFQIFSTGRKYGWDVDFIMDGYRNDWLSGTNPAGFRASMVNLRLNGHNNQVTLGDFFQSGSEISVSSRKVFGLKYETEFIDMGRGGRMMKLAVLGGETARPLAVDDHNPEVPNDTIAQGSAVRQQMMGMGRLSIAAMPGLTVGAQLIHARDLMESVLRKAIDSTNKTSSMPIRGTSAGVDVEYRFFKEQLVARAEVAGGFADSSDEHMRIEIQVDGGDTAYDTIYTYTPKEMDVQYKDAAAGSFGLGAELGKYMADISFTTVRPQYYSGGNPYLTQDQHQGKVTGSAQISENTSADFEYELTIRNASYYTAEEIANGDSVVDLFLKPLSLVPGVQTSPIQNRATLSSKHNFTGNMPELSGNYTLYSERYQKIEKFEGLVVLAPDTSIDSIVEASGDTVEVVTISPRDSAYTVIGPTQMNILKNTIGFSVKQPLVFLKNSNVKVDYRIQIENDLSDYVADSLTGIKDAIGHQVSGLLTTNHGKLAQSRFSAKYKVKTETKGNRSTDGYEVAERLTLNLIPRKLKLMVDGNYRKDFTEEDKTDGAGTQNTLGNTRAFGTELKYTISNKLSASVTGNYEKSYDETPNSVDNYSVIYSGLAMTYVF